MPACTVTSRARVGSSATRSCGSLGQRDGDQDALQHAAGELVRVLLQLLVRGRGCAPAPAGGRRALDVALCLGRGGDRRCGWPRDSWLPMVCTGLSAVIGSCGISASVSPRTLSMALRSAITSTPSISARAGEHGEVVGQQPEDAHRRRRLAGAGLADDGDGLAPVDGEADAVDGADDAVVGDQLDLEVADLQQRLSWSTLGCTAHAHAGTLPCGGRRSRRPSPTGSRPRPAAR